MLKHKLIVTAIALVMSNLAHADLSSGLVAYYPFNGNANDASGNGNNGTVNGATLTADRFGNANSAYSFDGASYINVNHSSLLNVNTHTIAAWVKLDDGGGGFIIGKVNQTIHETIELDVAADTEFCTWFATDREINHELCSIGIIEKDSWHFIAMTYDGSKIDFYRDGLFDTSYPRTGTVRTATSNLAIGRHGGDGYIFYRDYGYFKGSIDDIHIYNRALSAAEITELYNLGNIPTAITAAATNITATSANLNAQVNSNGSDAIVGFNLGPTTTYGTNVAAVPDVVSGTAAVTGTATGLTCNTIYHYRIEATNSFGTNYGTDQSFTTAVCPVPPTAITNDATGVNATAAILNGSINPNGIAVTAVSFDYGSTTAYGASVNANPNTINAGFNPVNVSAVKGGFTCNTTYHYRLTATNDYGTGYGADKTFTTTTANCQAAPVVVTTAPTLITVDSATLNGQVTSNPITIAVSFDFGSTNAYGTSVATTSNQIYSATPVAISAVKTGLSCATEYHYRAKAVNSIGTGLGLDQSFTTETCPQAVNAWLAPPTLTKIRDQVFTLDVIANSNSVKLGSYMFVVTLDTTKLVLDTTYQNISGTCSKGVCPGTNAVANRATIVNAAGNTITLTGDDSAGVAPGNDLQLLVMHLKTKLTTGATPVTLTTSALDATSGETIGLAARGATVNVSYGYCGDSDGNTRVNIIDALAIARKLVGLPPPPTIDDLLADTNKNSRVDINDALFIARYAVGLVLPPEACNIGQPL